MSHYKLTYFNLMALGEPIRMLLTYLGKDFEDNRIERQDWPAIKPTMPFGKLPILEIDGKKLNQSVAICRYLGKQAGLAGKNDWEALQIDMIVDTFNDFRIEVSRFVQEQDPAAKEKRQETLMKETIPFYMGKFETIIKTNGGYLANTSLSWGDIYVTAFTDTMNGLFKKDLLAEYPQMKALKEKVQGHPKIKPWINKRPKTDF